MGKMLKKIKTKQLNDSIIGIRKIKNYIDISKDFFNQLDLLLQDNSCNIQDIKNMYYSFKDRLGVK